MREEPSLPGTPWSSRCGRWLGVSGLLALLLPALGVLASPRGPGNRQGVPEQHASGALRTDDLQGEIAGLVRRLTLATVDESQRQEYRFLRERYESAGEHLREQPGFPAIRGLLDALGALLVEESPSKAIPMLEGLEGTETDPQTQALTLVLLGVAHHRESGQEGGHQSHTQMSERYFQRAEALPYRLGLASNGLAAQWALRGFKHLEQGEIDPALRLLQEAEAKFARASDTDGSRTASYRHFNNTAYIREKLLVAYLDGRVREAQLLTYSDLGSVEEFIDNLDQRMAEVRRFADPGSWAAEKASAECLSITGEYFQRIGKTGEAARRLALSRSSYLDAVDEGLHHGESREDVRRSLEGSRLLKAMLGAEGALQEILDRVPQALKLPPSP